MLESIETFDQELFLQLNNLGSQQWDFFWLTITNKLTWIPLYLLLSFLIYKRFGWRVLLLTFALIGIMVGLNESLTNALKEDWVKRLRPCFTYSTTQMRQVKESCGGQFGFTSAHASNHFAIAIFLGLLLRKQANWIFYVFLFWAFMIAYSRIYIGVHYPLDVIAGAIIGVIFGTITHKLHTLVQQRMAWFQSKT